jgi:hypothetical protein
LGEPGGGAMVRGRGGIAIVVFVALGVLILLRFVGCR